MSLEDFKGSAYAFRQFRLMPTPQLEPVPKIRAPGIKGWFLWLTSMLW